MNILFVTAPMISFNHTLHYRYTDIGEVISFLENQRPHDKIRFWDGLSWQIESSLLSKVMNGVEVLIFFSDVASAPSTLRLARMVKMLMPEISIMVYGKGPLRIPAYFFRDPFDAVHTSGDQEKAIISFIDYLEGYPVSSGIWINGEHINGAKSERLSPDLWGFPALERLPVDDYKRISKIKGIEFELSIYPSKGCIHTNCRYCDAWLHEGIKDRRRDPDDLVSWVEEAVLKYRFDCVQMHSTDFCADPEWVLSFSRAYRDQQCHFRWTCCARIDSITQNLLREMASAGCYRIGIGIENIPYGSSKGIKGTVDQMKDIVRWSTELGIRCKGYIMACMPGQSELDLLHTYFLTQQMGYIPRVSTFTPFHELEDLSVEELDMIDLARYDRKSYIPDNLDHKTTVLRLLVRLGKLDKWLKREYERVRRVEKLKT